MGAQTILTRMPNGMPGAVTRAYHSTTEARFLTADTLAGTPMTFDPANPGKLTVRTAATQVPAGLVTRSYPVTTAADSSYPSYNTFGEVPLMSKDRAVSILRSGYMTVLYEGTNPVVTGQTVQQDATGKYVDTGGFNVGPSCYYNGPALPGTVVEIVYNI